jgi:hypothetical protein
MYSPEQLNQFYKGKMDVTHHIHKTIEMYLELTPSLSEKSQEHCKYGICRRLFLINECLNFFFDVLPPENKTEVSREKRSRANIHLHAFLINICGITDNMAWLWAYQIRLEDQLDIEKHKMSIGLFKQSFSKYLPQVLANKTTEYKEWHKFAIDHRHPTAHRIPPYIIPYTVPDESETCTRDYTPRYIHSVSTEYGSVYLHPQSLADANTILSLLDTLLIGLNERMA